MLFTKMYNEEIQRIMLEFLSHGYYWVVKHCGNDRFPLGGSPLAPEQVALVAAAFGDLSTALGHNSYINDSYAVAEARRELDKIFANAGMESPFAAGLHARACAIRETEEFNPELEQISENRNRRRSSKP
jgi:hypothetical protein